MNKQTNKPHFPKLRLNGVETLERLISLSLSLSLSCMLKIDIPIEPRHCKLSHRIPCKAYKFQQSSYFSFEPSVCTPNDSIRDKAKAHKAQQGVSEFQSTQWQTKLQS
jgi:hypothetical protein